MCCKCNKFKACKIILFTLILSLIISLLICVIYFNNKSYDVLTAIAVEGDNTRAWNNYYNV